ncbi:hypothetical protein [Sporosarcina sp. Marseille-Q4943]|uniref:hypothetical protein n=1 Tax=Sporosarcina sp. Marseille-Q4943 TaxID=2942204 RepID=UPI00208DD17A|nr:hypothetical protein [Sporosarcina sp. Marseille-Q4943]
MFNTEPKICVECGKLPALHWNRSFCLDCFTELLTEKLKEGEEHQEDIQPITC